jgi:hypothetical protein
MSFEGGTNDLKSQTIIHEESIMTYEELLAAAKADPGGGDYHALRMAFAHTDEYAPYVQDAENIEKLRVSLTDRDMESALDAVAQLLAQNYLDIEAHMAADYAHTMLEQYDDSAYHRAFARGLIQAILATGDGRGFETAFIVLNVSEEYTVLRVMGLVPGNQRLIEHEGHWFDILSGRQRETNSNLELYFNIDLPRGWLRDNIR